MRRPVAIGNRRLLLLDGLLKGLVALSVGRKSEKGRAGDKHVGPEVEELFCVVQGHAAIDLDEGLEATGADCA